MEKPKLPKLQLTNYAPVTVMLVTSAIASSGMAILRAKYGLDFSGQEANITIVVGAIAGYLTGKAPRA